MSVRRTRAESGSLTQAALLDATLDCLAENGWAATTTRSVAKRAGLSQGALQHHFPSKDALVEAALDHLLGKLAAAALESQPPEGDERERVVVLLDRLWAIHTLPISGAVHELITVARVEPYGHLAARFGHVLNSASNLTQSAAEELLPNLARTPGFDAWLLTVEATMRGSVAALLPQAAHNFPQWPTIRDHLLDALDALIERTEKS